MRCAGRFPRRRAGLALALLLGLAACETYDKVVTFLLPGSIALPAGAFEQPAVPLTGPARARFVAGHEAFQAACGACHRGDDRGAPAMAAGGFAETAILRLTPPDPHYGAWLDHREASAEARVAIAFQVLEGRFSDGEAYELRLPRSEVSDFAAGPLAEGTAVSPRAAPPVIGYGLIAAIADNATGSGRFGWKAAAPGFAHDGLAEPAESDGSTGDLAYYLDNLGAPPRGTLDDAEVRRGGAVFATAGCPACHLPRALAGASEGTPETEFYPYSDFLLHDMGAGLADMGAGLAGAGGGAGAQKWRTAPLWGLGRSGPEGAAYLHDGRARSLMEAILWHGGEARAARKKVRALTKRDRDALTAFLESL